MAKKALKKIAKVLGGLGAAYLASGYIRPGVQPEDVNAEDAAKDEMDRQDRIARTRVDKPAAPVVYNPRPSLYANAAVPEPVQSRIVVPEDSARSASYRTSPYGLYPEDTFKKGGAVRGWGKARGARKAKVY